jgi:hypothetical protein
MAEVVGREARGGANPLASPTDAELRFMNIFKLIVERLVIMVVTIFILITLVFSPSLSCLQTPSASSVGQGQQMNRSRRRKNSDWMTQVTYNIYISKNLIQGDLGFSWRSRNLVIEDQKCHSLHGHIGRHSDDDRRYWEFLREPFRLKTVFP